jgi:tRNA-splicing ligase RtcB (3'-phosphate/5'-hydroxy nucleic acid ligase)
MNTEAIIFGQDHEADTLAQIRRCAEAEEGARGVLCADGHKGYSMPIGGVVAYRNSVSISGVGFDQACGNLAIRTDINADAIAKSDLRKIMDDIIKTISFGIGRTNNEKLDHEIFEDPLWEWSPFKELFGKARAQLGTVGSGNHYVDIFKDEENRIWVGVHFGSRGLGHGVTTWFLKAAGARDMMDDPPALLPINSNLGDLFIQGLQLTGAYAYVGREYVARKVVRDILQGKIVEEVHNHHNFAWKEIHGYEEFYVVRKGATPAFPGQKGFIGGSMGDDAVIIEGVDSELSRKALYSTVHGAGRIMSRAAAKGRFVREGKKKIRQPGLVRHDEMMKWLHEKGIELRGSDLDEAPQAYRRLSSVLKEHQGTIRVLHTLSPLGVAMAGKDIHDPYKD